MNLSLRAVIESVLIGVIASLSVIALFYIPVLNTALLIFPVPLVVIAVRRGTWAGILALLISGAILSVVAHPFMGPVIIALNIFLLIGLSWGFKKKLDIMEFFVLSAAGVLVSLFFSARVFSWLVGQGFFEYLSESIRSFFNQNAEAVGMLLKMYHQMGILDYPYSAYQFGELVITQLLDMLPLLPAMLIIFSLLIGGMNFLISRLVLKKLQMAVPYIPVFSEWALPKGTGRGFIVIMLAALLGTMIDIQNFNVVFYTITSIFSFIFSIQGLAVGAFFLKTKKVHKVLRVLILGTAFIFFSIVLTFLGMFEQIFHLRLSYLDNTPNS